MVLVFFLLVWTEHYIVFVCLVLEMEPRAQYILRIHAVTER
jgi:hypothetical protein